MKESDVQKYYNIICKLNQTTDDLIFLWDLTTDLVYLAKEIKRLNLFKGQTNQLYHYSLEQLFSIVHPLDLPLVKKTINNIKQNLNDSTEIAFRIVNLQKQIHWITCRGQIVTNKDNEHVLLGHFSSNLYNRIDSLTGLMNFNYLQKNMSLLLQKNQRGHFIVLGIDNLSNINQRLGRSTGNALLKQIAIILRSYIDDSTNVYRMDGDRFGIVLENCTYDKACRFFYDIQEKMSDLCTISAGIVAFPYKEIKDFSLINQYAEIALYKAKKLGKNRCEYFLIDDYNQTLKKIEVLEEIKQSIKNDFQGFELFYQPQITPTLELYGAEALLRYHSPQYGFISPDILISLLEQSKLIIDVGKWILKTAINQCALWRKIRGQFHISINFSYVQLQDKHITKTIFDLLHEANLPGNAISIELTESMQLQNFNEYNNLFFDWRQQGISVSIDDFGTGYSSLNYIKNLEVDEIKIDRSFIHYIHNNSYNYHLVKNMTDLFHHIHMRVCCEGVETIEELKCCYELNCDILQGYYFSKPLDRLQFEKTFIMPPLNLSKGRFMQHLNEIAPQLNQENNIFKEILNHLDTLVYVCDAQTNEIYYMNSFAKRCCGIYDYNGKKCHEVFFDKNKPCPFCNQSKIEKNKFYSWEVYNHHLEKNMFLEEKLIEWENKTCRLVLIKLDHPSSKKENEFILEQSLLNLYEQCLQQKESPEIIDLILQHDLDFYQAHCASLFLCTPHFNYWKNIRIKCASGVMPDCYFFPDEEKRLVSILKKEKILFVDNEFKAEHTLPAFFDQVDSCILSSLWDDSKLIGFLCIKDPKIFKYHPTFITQSTRLMEYYFIQQNTVPLQLSSENELNNNISVITELGFWTMEYHPDGQNSLIGDQTFLKLLGLDYDITPAQCYAYWYNHISDGYFHYVLNALETMAETDEVIELEYQWVHATRGLLNARCVGRLTRKKENTCVLQGYLRFNDDMTQLRFLSSNKDTEIIKYDRNKRMIRFYTERLLIHGNNKIETNFPQCWIEKKMIHEKFVDEFIQFFNESNVFSKVMDLVMKNVNNEDEWFHLQATRINSQQEEDQNVWMLKISPIKEKKKVNL